MAVVLSRKGGGSGGGGAPSGPAGGVLSGTYPNPGFAVDMATQAELDAVSAGITPLSGKVIGAYYTTPLSGGPSNWNVTVGQPVNVLTCMPIWLRTGTLDRIAQQHIGATVGGETARMGIYSDNGLGSPGALLLDAGTIDLSTAAAIKAITISQAVTAGLYWLALVKQGSSTATLIGNIFHGSGRVIMPARAPAGTNLYDNANAFTMTGVSGALPNPFVGTTATTGDAANNVTPPFVRYSA